MAHQSSFPNQNSRAACSSALEHAPDNPPTSGYLSFPQLAPPASTDPDTSPLAEPRRLRGGRLAAMPSTSYDRVPVALGSVLVNHNGRIAERSVLGSLGWAPGVRIDIRSVAEGVLHIVGDPNGEHAIAPNGQLQIPAAIRRRVRLRIGHRVLLAAHPDRNRLIVVCESVLQEVVADIATVIDGGEQQ